MKNILVCVKAVPSAAQVQVDGEYRLKRDGVSLQWNIADEAALELPCVSNVERIEQLDSRLKLYRRLEDGILTLEVTGRAVVSICEYSYTLRLPGILSMRRAKTKQVELYSASDLQLEPGNCGLKGSLTKVTAMESRFPGLRKGPKEEDPKAGAEMLLAMIREVQP